MKQEREMFILSPLTLNLHRDSLFLNFIYLHIVRHKNFVTYSNLIKKMPRNDSRMILACCQ